MHQMSIYNVNAIAAVRELFSVQFSDQLVNVVVESGAKIPGVSLRSYFKSAK